MLLNLIVGILGGIIGGSIIFLGNIFLYAYETKSRNNAMKNIESAIRDAVKATKNNPAALAKVLQFKGPNNSPDKVN